MALQDMIGELMSIPKVASPFAKTKINEALQKIYDESTWSFQLGESGWLTPNAITAGTVTFTQFSNQVVGDATAAAAWNAITGLPLITQRQIRNPAYNLYNIVAYDGVNTLTLDRIWMEPITGAGQVYEMYQSYYPAPSAGFKRFLAIQDFTDGWPLDFWSYKQSTLAVKDPQRTIKQNPYYVAPFGSDQRANSATLGRMLFELWPHQLAQLPYALYFVADPAPLANRSDAVPYPLTDELVKARARVLLYEWCESQKGVEVQRGSGADYRFLMQAADAEYKDRLKDIRKKDRDLADSFWTKIRRMGGTFGGPYYNAMTQQANVGA